MNKKFFALLAVVCAIGFFVSLGRVESSERVEEAGVSKPVVMRASAFGESARLSGIVAEKNSNGAAAASEAGFVNARNANFEKAQDNKRGGISTGAHDADGSIATMSAVPMPEPSLSFDGMANSDNVAAYNLLISPPDMNGDVGPNHYVQIVNSLVRVYNKSGAPLTPPIKLNDFFAGLNTPCATRFDGLPNVLYDTLADRWLIAQVCSNFPPFKQLIAISKTGDPTGQYFLYEFVMPNIKQNDFPKLGVWPDAYYMTTDEFFGADYVGSGAFAFDRAKMLAGDPTATYIYFNRPAPPPLRRGGLLPADLDGMRAPASGTPGIFAGYSATEYGDAQDAVRLFDFRADFANPLNSTFTERAESPIPVAAFDPTSPDGRPDIAQPAPGERLDSISDRLNHRLAYRNHGTHESLVVNQTVRTTPIEQIYRAGVRVYELRKTGGAYSAAEQTTIGDTILSRWIGAAAQDHQGNLAVGYNVGSETKRPSIHYTGKLASEPAGTFRDEGTLIDGTGVQKAFGWRWGEYSGMTVDPVDDCTFWMTNVYYTLASQEYSDFGWLTRIGRFKFDECTPALRGNVSGSLINNANNAPIPSAPIYFYPNRDLNSVPFVRYTIATGQTETGIIPPGQYTAVGKARGFRDAGADVIVTAGNTSFVNLRLDPIPVLESTASVITAESCRINNAPEPGESVTMNVTLRNSGGRGAANLTAAILPTGGIANPGPVQNFGPLGIGESATRPFMFSISGGFQCGAVAILSLQMRDGAETLGTVNINLQTGEQVYAFRENFDGVTAPALPAGWTTSTTPNHQLWRTSATRNQTPANSLFSPDPTQAGVNEVMSPQFTISSSNAEIVFRNWYELETTFLRNRLYDGSVLEVKIGSGAFQDILTAGGTFLSGGYDGTIDGCCQNPLAGRLGWSGRSGINQTSEFITTRAKLPASAAGQNVQLRWRLGSDIGGHREGQYIDNLAVTDGYSCGCASVRLDPPFDFDGDGRTDLSVYNLNNGTAPDFRIRKSSDQAEQNTSWGSTDDLPANADFDGDGKTDYAVFRPSNGVWYVLRSSNGTVGIAGFGLAGDRPVPTDFDGDSRDDIAVFRPATGVWYVLRSLDGQVFVQNFGLNGDVPVAEDYDGDSRADIAVFRPASGVWYVSRSSNSAFFITQFGLNGDKPVPGDFDGDGQGDLAVYRPSDGTWYFLQSTNGFAATRFGLSSDKPLQADIDGDGKRDIAVFRPSSRIWYFLRSSDAGFTIVPFGDVGENALPGIYIE